MRTEEEKINHFLIVKKAARDYATNSGGEVNLIEKRAFLAGFNYCEKQNK